MRVAAVARRLAAVEMWVVALFAVASVAAERLLPGALAVAAAFWLVRWLTYGRPSVRTAGDWAIGLLILLLPVTLWATALPEVTRPQVLQLLMGIALYYAAANWAVSAGRLAALLAGLVAAGLALAALAPFLGATPAAVRFIPAPLAGALARVTGTLNPNIVAGALALLAPLALAGLLFAPGRPWGRILAAAAALGMLAAIVLSQSRGAWIAVTCAGLLLVVLRWRWGWLAALAAVAGGALAVWRIGPQQAAEMAVAGKALGGMDQRLEIWSRALYMLQDFPFTGIGMGTFRQVANLLYPFFLAGPDAEIPHAHNLFLQVGVDLGLPGLIAWTALLLLVFVAGWQVYRRGRVLGEGRLAGLGAGVLASQVALVVHGLTDAPVWGTRPAVVVWALWGLAMAALALVSRTNSASAPNAGR